MANQAIEKLYQPRTLSEDQDGYLRLCVPPDVIEDPRYGLEPGAEVRLRGVINGEEAHLRLEKL